MQGFDFQAWVQDSMSGQISFFGQFRSLTLSVRDATETYLELGQRIPIYLNGEIQISWVLEQGLVDMGFLGRAFGLSAIRRDQVITRGPRFQVCFDANAAELGNPNNSGVIGDPSSVYRRGTQDLQVLPGVTGFVGGDTRLNPSAQNNYPQRPIVGGRYELQRCKVDSVSLGVMPGRKVADVRWEGVAEGITYIPVSLQEFKNDLNNPNQLRNLVGATGLNAGSQFTPTIAGQP